MTRWAVAVMITLAAASTARAEWQLYKEDGGVVASFDYVTFAPFRGKPSVWVRWHYVTTRDGIGGRKLQFTADCAAGKLYEIAAIPYDADGNYLAGNRHYDEPTEYPLPPGSLNEATYKLLCRQP